MPISRPAGAGAPHRHRDRPRHGGNMSSSAGPAPRKVRSKAPMQALTAAGRTASRATRPSWTSRSPSAVHGMIPAKGWPASFAREKVRPTPASTVLGRALSSQVPRQDRLRTSNKPAAFAVARPGPGPPPCFADKPVGFKVFASGPATQDRPGAARLPPPSIRRPAAPPTSRADDASFNRGPPGWWRLRAASTTANVVCPIAAPKRSRARRTFFETDIKDFATLGQDSGWRLSERFSAAAEDKRSFAVCTITLKLKTAYFRQPAHRFPSRSQGRTHFAAKIFVFALSRENMLGARDRRQPPSVLMGTGVSAPACR